METLEIYDKSLVYARNLLNYNHQNKLIPFTAEDLAAEALCAEVKDIDQAIVVIRNIVCLERRKVSAEKQAKQYGSSIGETEKKCANCKEDKPYNEFKPIQDERSGLKCYHCVCYDCEKDWRRKKYLKNEKGNKLSLEKAKLRGKRYWERQQKLLSDKWIIHNNLRRHDKSKITHELIAETRTKVLDRRKNGGLKEKVISVMTTDLMTSKEISKLYDNKYSNKNISATLSLLKNKGIVQKINNKYGLK